MANSFRNDFYRPIKTLSVAVMALMGGLGFCAVLYVFMSLVVIFAPDATINLGKESFFVGWGVIGLVGLLEIPLRISAVIVFLFWIYRAYGNLSALKARNLEFSPGWAVGWWFIPFANLVKPFQIMREIYNESDPDFDEETGFLNINPGTPEIIGFWWAALLISNFIYRISDKMIDLRTGEPSPYFPTVFLVAGIIHAAAAVLIILIVKTISERQEQRFNKITHAEQFVPPPPPTFENNN